MANLQIKIKRSSVPGRIPTVQQLPLGELAINTSDGKVFLAKNSGIGSTEIVEVGISTSTVLSGIITTTNLQVTNIITGISSGSSKVNVISDGGNQWHYIPYLDGKTGYQDLRTNSLTYNPFTGRLVSGIGSFQSIQGNLVAVAATITTINGLNYPTADGLTNQVLKTDGNGNLSFANVGGSGGGQIEENFTATNNQTLVTTVTSFGSKYIQVFLNGVKTRETSDWTRTSTSSITFQNTLSSGDEIDIVIFT
jgi:hypothetical protein